jgi:hypothetical protein
MGTAIGCAGARPVAGLMRTRSVNVTRGTALMADVVTTAPTTVTRRGADAPSAVKLALATAVTTSAKDENKLERVPFRSPQTDC